MEEQKLNEEAKPLMSEEEFKQKLEERKQQMMENIANGVLYLRDYSGVKRFKSIRRAIRRGHVSIFGEIYPKRPFGNTRTKQNDLKRKIYAELRNKQRGL